MSFILKDLPYPKDELYPYFSEETLTYHHDRHQNAYVLKLNQLLADATLHEQEPNLVWLIQNRGGPIQAQAEQIWNHQFFWTCFAAAGKNGTPTLLNDLLRPQFENFQAFKSAICHAALNHFASGWLWLWVNEEGRCVIETLPNSENPLRRHHAPILTIDLWEHAYYIDFRHDRKAYLEACLSCLNWPLLAQRWQAALER